MGFATCDKCGTDDCDDCGDYNDYSVQIFDFEKFIRAKTKGKAKYLYWLSFRDAYDMSFGEFLKKARCRKVS